MTDYQNFTSLSPELERQFVPFERRTVESGKKAWTISLVASAAFGLVMMVVVFSFEPPKNVHAESPGGFGADVEESAETPSAAADEAGEEPAAVEEAPAEEEAAEEEAAAGGEGEAEGETEAPPPPKGAKKAPPTDLVGN